MTTIAAVESFPIAYPEPNDAGNVRSLLLVKITSRDGRSGWGEAVTMFPEASKATAEVVEALGRQVIGRDAEDHSALVAQLREHVWWYGGAGIASFALSAIDIALWDLRGHILDRPVLELLGGQVHPDLPVLVSCHAFVGNLEQMAATMAGWVRDHGAQGIKVGFGKKGDADLGRDRERDREFVRLLREALGPQARIALDIGARIHWDLATAVGRAQDWAPYDIAWLEEPLGADDPAGYRALRAATDIPLGYGEQEWNARGIDRIVATGTVDLVGVDPGRVEGLTGFQRANERIVAHQRQVNAHAWSSAIVTAASLAASLAAANCRQIEIKPLPNPMQDELVADPIRPRAGRLGPLPGPGLGIEVDEAVVARYRLP